MGKAFAVAAHVPSYKTKEGTRLIGLAPSLGFISRLCERFGSNAYSPKKN